MKFRCRIGAHNMTFVKNIEVPERGYLKVYEVRKCKDCGKMEISMKDLVPTDIVQFGK